MPRPQQVRGGVPRPVARYGPQQPLQRSPVRLGLVPLLPLTLLVALDLPLALPVLLLLPLAVLEGPTALLLPSHAAAMSVRVHPQRSSSFLLTKTQLVCQQRC